MITYNADERTFSSKFKVYKIEEVSENLIYDWVKSGKLSLKAFSAWVFYNAMA